LPFAYLPDHPQDDPAAAINGLLQALRLWNRAVDTISKVAPVEAVKDVSSESDNPFLVEATDGTSMDQKKTNGTFSSPSMPHRSTLRLPALDGIEWRVAHGLIVNLFALTQAYLARGSPREAEYFAQQARDVAESLNTPAMAGRALARVGEIYLHLHQVEDSHASLVKAAEFAAGTAGPDTAEISRLRAEYSRLHSNEKEAQQLYEQAMAMLEELDITFATLDGQSAGCVLQPYLITLILMVLQSWAVHRWVIAQFFQDHH
jgi:separase